jgi:hypothetical protein
MFVDANGISSSPPFVAARQVSIGLGDVPVMMERRPEAARAFHCS